MTAKAKTALAASVAATLLGAGSAMAALMLNFKLQGRVITDPLVTPSTPFTDVVTLTQAQAAAGSDIQYQIIVDMAPVGTSNALGTINSLDYRPDIDGEP